MGTPPYKTRPTWLNQSSLPGFDFHRDRHIRHELHFFAFDIHRGFAQFHAGGVNQAAFFLNGVKSKTILQAAESIMSEKENAIEYTIMNSTGLDSSRWSAVADDRALPSGLGAAISKKQIMQGSSSKRVNFSFLGGANLCPSFQSSAKKTKKPIGVTAKKTSAHACVYSGAGETPPSNPIDGMQEVMPEKYSEMPIKYLFGMK